MDFYQQANNTCIRTYGRLINVKSFNDELLERSQNTKYVKQIADITDGEGLKNAYGAKDGLYQH